MEIAVNEVERSATTTNRPVAVLSAAKLELEFELMRKKGKYEIAFDLNQMSNSIVELESLPPAARTHSAPNLTKLGLTGQYAPSPCGTDTNLLILLHGLGDTEAP